MRKLAIAAAVSIGLGTYSASSIALGLGEIEMYSTLNQTLDAEIGILSALPAEIDGLAVRLAPLESFSRAGLDRLPILSAMQFRVERRPDGQPVVKITSDVPVVEPFLNFLLTVDSPLGQRLVREYTVLLDPPVFTAQRSTAGIANIPESTAIDIEKEIGASTPIERVLNNPGPAVTANSVNSSGGVAVDLSNELIPTPGINNAVDFSAGEEVVLNLDDIAGISTGEPDIVETAPVADPVLTDAPQGEVVILDRELIVSDNGGVGAQLLPQPSVDSGTIPSDAIFTGEINVSGDQPVAFDEEAGQLIALEQELANDGIVASDQGELGGVSVSLDTISDGGGAIFADDGAPVATSAVDALAGEIGEDTLTTVTGGLEVDLSELLPRQQPVGQDLVPVAVAVDDADEGTVVDFSSVAVAQEGAVTVDIQSLGFGDEIDLSGSLASEAAISSTASAGGAGSYTVQPSDTLWSIARRNKPAGYTTQQMMVALLQANSGAFIDGDMNRLRNGASLAMPDDSDLSSTSNVEAVAAVREQTSAQTVAAPTDNIVRSEPSPEETDTGNTEMAVVEEKPLSIVGVDETVSDTATPATDQSSSGTDVARNLEEVNRRMQLAQEELASESMQRDELRGRVNELEDSMTRMKRLITLRESELSELQTELTTAKSDTDQAAADAEEKSRMLAEAEIEKSDMQKRLQALQEKIAANATIAQDRVDEQADADKNLASAEAQAQSVRLATEEDTIRAQLAALQEEKEVLIRSAQNDKVELVRQAEAEKSELLAQAKAERERIMAELESEKQRITDQAIADRERIASEAQAEKEQLIAEATAEREKLAAESEAMRLKLVDLEEEKARLMAEAELDKTQLQQAAEKAQQLAADQQRLQAEAEAEKLRVEEESVRVKDRLAQLQADASANLASSGEAVEAVVDDTVTEVNAVDVKAPDVAVPSQVADTAADLAAKGAAGAAAVGGLMAVEPLQKEIGNRKTVLAAGGGIALLGLLGAWFTRRRKPEVREDIDLDRGTSVPRSSFNNRPANYEAVDEAPRNSMGSAAVAASAAAAAAGSAAAASRSAAQNRTEDQEQPVDAADKDERLESAAVETAPVLPAVVPEAAANDDSGSRLSDSEPVEDAASLDDTITEAEVYLRYGLHGQAEDLLQTAIERSPDNEEYHFKLLENYHDQKNESGFNTAATEFQSRFGNSARWERVAEMGRDLEPGNTLFSRVTAMGSSPGLVAGGAAAAGGVVSAIGSPEGGADTVDGTDVDATIDANAEFNMSDLDATGQFDTGSAGQFSVGRQFGDGAELTDLGDVTLDEVDLAALDDDGTLNLEELAGDQMSGLDLGSLDLTNTDGDSTLDNLTLDDADLNSLGDVTSNLRSGLETDVAADDLDAGLSANSDEMETMLDLAKAYIDMGDNDSAASALQDIAANGNATQKLEANELLKSLG